MRATKKMAELKRKEASTVTNEREELKGEDESNEQKGGVETKREEQRTKGSNEQKGGVETKGRE